jgi:hypothetical protein
VIGIALRRRRPEWCKRYVKFCSHRKWWLYGSGVLLFSILAVNAHVSAHPYLAAFYLAFALLEAYCFFQFGFRVLTPEMKNAIDQSDPTSVWPFRIWNPREEERDGGS